MKTLIYGAGPIGQWLALQLHAAGEDVTLLARGETFEALQRDGVRYLDAVTGQRLHAAVPLVRELGPDDRYDLALVSMVKASRLAVCPVLARNEHIPSILFLGNDVAGPAGYLEHLAEERVLLGFPGAGGGWVDGELVISDRDKPGGKGQVFLGEIDGATRPRTFAIHDLLQRAGLVAHIEKDMDGWLKYHFAFVGPTAGAIFEHGMDMKAVAADRDALHRYAAACREAGDVLAAVGHTRRQPSIFHLYYWLPRFLEPVVFQKLFGSDQAQVKFGLHAHAVGPEMLDLVAEFGVLKERARLETPHLDALMACIAEAEVAA